MKINIENILNKHLGKSVYASGESTLNSTKIKTHNPRRLALAESFIYTDKLHYAKNRAEQVVLIQTYGEASDVVKNLKNKAVDVWRIVKTLLGKLMIVIEEQISKVFDNTKKLTKIADETNNILAKAQNWSIKTIKEEEIEFDMPASVFAANNGAAKSVGKNANIVTVANIAQASAMVKATKQDTEAVKKMFETAKSKKTNYKAIVKRAKSVKATDLHVFTLTGGQNQINNPNTGNTNGPNVKKFDTFIDLAASTEVLSAELKAQVLNFKNYMKDKENFVKVVLKDNSGVKKFLELASDFVQSAEAHVQLATLVREFNFEFKKEANILKNLPTSVTNSMKAEQLERMRTIIARATKASGIIYKAINWETSKKIKENQYIYKAIKQMKEIIERDNDSKDAVSFK